MDFEFENNSGQGKNSPVPEEIKGWSWGAFFLNWIWGIGNSTFIALLMFVPIVNIAMPFVLGAKGNKWAWQNRTWRSVEQFKKTQKKWAISGLVLIFVFLPSIFFFVTGIMKNSEAYELSFAELKNNTEVIQMLGNPIDSGFFVTGQIRTGGGSGNAEISYSISGPNGEATAYVYAVKEMGKWKLLQLIVHSESLQQRINIINTNKKDV